MSTSWPANSAAGTRHESTAVQRLPPAASGVATSTVQAPHSPSPHASRTPVQPSERKQLSRLVRGSVSSKASS